MGIGANDVGMDKRGTVSLATVARSPLECGVAGHRIGAVDFFEMEVGESGNQTRNVAPRGLEFDRNRNGVPIVLNAENNRKVAQRDGVHGFPELAFTGSAVAQRNVSHFIALEADLLKLAVVGKMGGGNVRCLGMPRQIASCLGAANCLQNL